MAEPSYYYAADRKVPIALDDEQVAVDFARLHGASLKIRQWSKVLRASPSLWGELHLVNRSEIPDDLYAELTEKSALQPVYRYEDSLLVVLPEVRVEGTKTQQARIRDLITKGPVRAAVEREEGRRLVLRPVSGKGEDAIALANSVHESVRPTMTEAHFIQVVPAPALKRA